MACTDVPEDAADREWVRDRCDAMAAAAAAWASEDVLRKDTLEEVGPGAAAGGGVAGVGWLTGERRQGNDAVA